MEIREGKLDKILGKGRYHSVVASTYNFDPLFISKVFIPILHSKRIRNISIIADPKEFYSVFSSSESISSFHGSSSIIIPATSSRLFHPKVMYFVGEKGGLCVVGSGNLTHSGMGGNSEVWGAFHCSAENREYAHVFQQAWNFLREFVPELTGIANAKNEEWILNNSPWLKQILSESIAYEYKEAFLLANSEDNTIWKRLEAIISDLSIEEVIVVSPFYDRNGLVLKKLRDLYPDAEISMIYDKQGTIPEIKANLGQVNCYAWERIKNRTDKKDESRSRLHAKLIYLNGKNSKEYLLFGSSNATNSGLGININKSSSNVELSVFAISNSNELRESIGIEFGNLKPEDITEIEVHENSRVEPTGKHRNIGLRIIYAEQEEQKITAFFNQDIKVRNLEVLFYDNSDNKVENISKVEQKKSSIHYVVENKKDGAKEPQVAYVEFRDGNCRVPVYHYRKLSLDNPDSRSELLRNTLSDIGSVDFGSLHDSFWDIFLELEKKRQEKSLSSHGTVDNKSSSDKEKETLYSKDELIEKKKVHSHSIEENFIGDGVMALLAALNKQLIREEDIEANLEAVKTDSSEEIEHPEKDNRVEKSPEEVLVSVKGYRNYFGRVLRYYEKFLDSYDNGKNLEEGPYIDRNFIMNWLLVISIANHVILENAKTEPIYEKELTEIDVLDSKTTILPHNNSDYTSISNLIKILIPRIVGNIQLSNVNMISILDEDQLIESAINIITLIHLKHWNEREISIFINLCENVLMLFNIDDEKSLRNFKSIFTEYTAPFLSEDVKINDWRYYNNIKTNSKHFEKITLPH